MTSPCHTTTHKTIAPSQICNLSQPPSTHHNQFAPSPILILPAIALITLITPSTSHTPSVVVAPPMQSCFRNRRSSAVCYLFLLLLLPLLPFVVLGSWEREEPEMKIWIHWWNDHKSRVKIEVKKIISETWILFLLLVMCWIKSRTPNHYNNF